jgi:hypothetical protein
MEREEGAYGVVSKAGVAGHDQRIGRADLEVETVKNAVSI